MDLTQFVGAVSTGGAVAILGALVWMIPGFVKQLAILLKELKQIDLAEKEKAEQYEREERANDRDLQAKQSERHAAVIDGLTTRHLAVVDKITTVLQAEMRESRKECRDQNSALADEFGKLRDAILKVVDRRATAINRAGHQA